MESDRHIRNLALTGFMGVGKSTVGHLAAEYLGFDFVDTDHLIESGAGKSIARIFEEEGEDTFRRLEAMVIAGLHDKDQTVFATGGGLGANLDHLASLKQHALVVCLWTTPEVIWERVRRQSHRPLLQTPDPMARIRELLVEREPVYRQADVLMETGFRQMREIAHQVVHQFRLATTVRPSPSWRSARRGSSSSTS